MTEKLSHRGPDDAGTESLSLPGGFQLHLGHCRLSILDLTLRGHQPMSDPLTGSWIVFNGEIYNHRSLRRQLAGVSFRSNSDTETLLRGWLAKGPEWIRSLRGIFAFALYDGQRRELWLARDHLGVKPLYVAEPEPGLWLFASEVRALQASGMLPKRLSAEGVTSYLAFGAVQSPWTIVDNARSIMPAERWCFSLGEEQVCLRPRVSRYWDLADYSSPDPELGESHIQMNDGRVEGEQWGHLCRTWEHAVESQMLSDVPVGVFLSGGTDSSAIVGTLKRLGHNPKTFSVGFAERGFDESRYSECIAQQYGTEHQAIAVSPNDVLGQFENMLNAYDQPSIDGINTYTIAQAVRRAGIKVAISGLGGDEGFAGYPTFRRVATLERWSGRLPRELTGIAASAFALAKPGGKLARLASILRNARSRLDVYCTLRLLFSSTARRELLAEEIPNAPGLEADLMRELSRQAEAMDVVNAVSMLEMRLYMQNMLLRDTDQMAMAHGLEVRVPLLDHTLIEEVARIPGALKLPPTGQPNKWLLVKLAGDTLPRRVTKRRKMGFVFPWDAWLRRELRGQVEEIILDRTAVERAGLRGTEVASFWRRYLTGERGLRSSEVLALVHLTHWAAANQMAAPYRDN